MAYAVLVCAVEAVRYGGDDPDVLDDGRLITGPMVTTSGPTIRRCGSPGLGDYPGAQARLFYSSRSSR